jgi:hypothetical protein
MGNADRQQRESDARRRARRRRALDEVFGDVVPEVTQDESADSAAAASGPSPRRPTDERDDEIRSDVPPHHA